MNKRFQFSVGIQWTRILFIDFFTANKNVCKLGHSIHKYRNITNIKSMVLDNYSIFGFVIAFVGPKAVSIEKN